MRLEPEWNEIGKEYVDAVEEVFRKRKIPVDDNEALIRDLARTLGFAEQSRSASLDPTEYRERLAEARKHATACARELLPVHPEIAQSATAVAKTLTKILDEVGDGPLPFKGDWALMNAYVGVYFSLGEIAKDWGGQALVQRIVAIIFKEENEEPGNFRKRLEQTYLPMARVERKAADLLIDTVVQHFNKSLSEKEMTAIFEQHAEEIRAMLPRPPRKRKETE